MTGGEIPSTLWHFVVPACGTLWALVADVMSREIPNRIPLSVTIWAISAEWLGWLPFSWGSLVLGFAAAFLAGIIGFGFHCLGGGDVKLLAALGASVGLTAVWPLLFWTALAGGVFGLIAACRRQQELAFAPAIAVGVAMVMVLEVLA